MEDNKDLIDKFSEEEDDALFKALDKTQEDLEDYLIEENKRIGKFIVRGIKNGAWRTFAIFDAYTIGEARVKALIFYKEPLVVMDLTLWVNSDDTVKRNVEEIVIAKHKRNNEEAK